MDVLLLALGVAGVAFGYKTTIGDAPAPEEDSWEWFPFAIFLVVVVAILVLWIGHLITNGDDSPSLPESCETAILLLSEQVGVDGELLADYQWAYREVIIGGAIPPDMYPDSLIRRDAESESRLAQALDAKANCFGGLE